MSLLVEAGELTARRLVVSDALAPLATSLRADLAPLLATTEIWLPPEKSRLTRTGGRCPVHGASLVFDPFTPREHRCPVCGTIYREEEHYRWWVMNYQLWLAERAVHGASLAATTGDDACRSLAERILSACAEAYLGYPNKDNVLGPTRPFFSTYLEAIWTLQLAVALDLLESTGPTGALGALIRERLLEPSLALIAQYDEGASNRQVWNNAALVAAGTLLGNSAVVARALTGRSGVLEHLRTGLLPDGSWYEGENYHQFAHRGLWFGVTMGEQVGHEWPAELRARFHEAFALPFATALPDFTFPARRDSQYAVSLRQWRFAESCELGLARAHDDRLRQALSELYRDDVPPGDTERSRSTGEAERNAPAARLTRASLGWKSLLLARAEFHGDTPTSAPRSVHLEAQGFAVFRRQEGRVYVALDYGTPGGGHGHPDRLNLWLVIRGAHWLEDVGTGSYVERTLFWYRSTLAHNAPLANGVSQPYGAGTLRAYDERDEVGWVEAEFDLVPGRSRVVRRLIVMPTYAIDELHWSGVDHITLDLPIHLDPADGPGGGWSAHERSGEVGSGFEFLREVQQATGTVFDAFSAERGGETLRVWISSDQGYQWLRAVGPGPPGGEDARFIIARLSGREGRFRSVWCWGDEVTSVQFTRETIALKRVQSQVDAHREIDQRWHVRRRQNGAVTEVVLGGRLTKGEGTSPAAEPDRPPMHVLTSGRSFSMELGERHYRRSELPWAEAGAPEATFRVAAGRDVVDVEVQVRKAAPVFAPRRAVNPLDNEDPDINSDGVQLYLYLPDSHAHGSWLLVPEGAETVRITAREAGGTVPALAANWRLTPDGYRVRCSFPRGARGLGIDRHFMLNVVINEISADRERRRGQLVATGAHDEWVYLRGDREDPRRLIAFEIVDG